MNEIERAIEFMYGQRTQAANLYRRNTDERVIKLIDRIVAYYDLAMQALRAELSRQENAPLTCEGCKRDDAPGFYKDCQHCKRNANDYYEPKGEKE